MTSGAIASLVALALFLMMIASTVYNAKRD
jgi:hypothetical protein